MTEQWRTIPDFPEYEVSDLGRVRNRKGRILMGARSGWKLAYRYISLRKTLPNGRRKSFSRAISRLVLMTFGGPPPDGQECCHINGIHHDDRFENLEWGTHSKNIRDQRNHGTWWRTGRQTLRPEDIGNIHRLRERGWSQTQIAEHFGVRQPQISRILNGLTWKYEIGEKELRYSATLPPPAKEEPPCHLDAYIPEGRPLTEEHVPQVIELAKAGSTRFEIARKLDLDPIAITSVLLGQHTSRPQ